MNSFDDSPIDDDSEQTQKTHDIAVGGYSVPVPLPHSKRLETPRQNGHTRRQYESSERG